MPKALSFPLVIRSGSVAVRIYRVKRPAERNRAERTFYSVSWNVGGRARLKQFSDLAAAKAEAKLKAEALSAGRSTAAMDLAMDDVALLTEMRRVAGQTPPLAALEEWARCKDICGGNLLGAAVAWRDAHGTGLSDIYVKDAVKAFIAAKDRAGVDTKASYRKTLPRLATGALADRLMASVTTQELENWIHETFRQGDAVNAHPSTYNTLRRRLITMWMWARKNGYLPKNAETEAEQLESAREHREQIGIVTASDYARILEFLREKHPEHLAVGIVAGFCGLRRSEIHGQKWADVNLERGFLKVSTAKKNTPQMRLVEIPVAAREWLLTCDRSGEMVSPPWGIDRVRVFVQAAGIPCPENGFRHGYISHRVAMTGDVAGTALQAGNSPSIIFKHYRELVSKEEGSAWFEIRPTAASGKVVRLG